MTQIWQPIEQTTPAHILESRVILHYAIQFIAAVGTALAEPLPDYSHTSLTWNPELEIFVGSTIRASQPFRVAIDPNSLTLILLNGQNNTVAILPLPGQTMASGLNWLKQEIAQLGVNSETVVFLEYPPDDFPDHPLAHGAAFEVSPNGLEAESKFQDLVTYYANTYSLLEKISSTLEDVTAIRIWPHHFDMAMLIMLPGCRNGSLLTVGVGLSPGDQSYPEPYWYVSPYPYPTVAELPNLGSNGFWHTQSWVGAVLTASQAVGDEQGITEQRVETFLNTAIQQSIVLLKPEVAIQVG